MALAKRGSWLMAGGSGLVAILVPKCPMCVALWLSGLGLSTSLASTVAPWLRPAAGVLVIVAGLSGLAYWLRARRSTPTPCCPQRG